MRASPYTDLDRPPLRGADLRRALVVPDGLWTRLDLHTETTSTNADAASAARGGAVEGLVVVAERQTAGRGRLGRRWESPARAGLAVSVLLRPGDPRPDRGWPAVPPSRYGWLPLLAGVALAESVARVAFGQSSGMQIAREDRHVSREDRHVSRQDRHVSRQDRHVSREDRHAALKWPNDLLLDGRKGGGILAEAVPGAGGGPAGVVIGVGLNVTLRSHELPCAGVTSLHLAGAECTDRDPLLRALLRSVAGWYERWRAAGGDAEASGLRQTYLDACATLGQEVRIDLPDGGHLTGRARTVDGEGRLVVRDAEGELTVAAGDVIHVRGEK